MQRLEEDIGLAGGDVGFLYVLGVFYQHTTRSAHSHAILAGDLLGRRFSPSGILEFDKVKQSKEEVFVQLDSHGL